MTVEKWVDCSTAADYLSKEPDWVRENLVALEIPHKRLGRQYRFKLSHRFIFDSNHWCQSVVTQTIALLMSKKSHAAIEVTRASEIE
jgi:hypothetical protein